ncbi:MAG: VOC family protein [Proteobacteria bacterium]|nr:VOC family protein [Pseudomonadota bacterium]
MASVSIRYIVDDVAKARDFYLGQLGFAPDVDALPAFASVTRGDLRLLLSGPLSSGGKPMPDGRRPVSGGWNRLLLVVDNIEAEVARLKKAGVAFRNELLPGVGGTQILLEDPFGNPVELFQPK